MPDEKDNSGKPAAEQPTGGTTPQPKLKPTPKFPPEIKTIGHGGGSPIRTAVEVPILPQEPNHGGGGILPGKPSHGGGGILPREPGHGGGGIRPEKKLGDGE
ncbi:MAG TPA: hypothetical protein VMG39_09245 [Pseudolabrys sp.]|nr:hypothetical protein [Pseudolabrys sp.]